ncbi:hypothetical protein AMK59_6774, partial [Oryctes borbonicus]
MGTKYVEARSRYTGSRWYIFVLLFILSSISDLESATVGRQQSKQPVQASQTSGKGRRVMDPAFANAGRTGGLEIWRIENFRPVAYPKSDYGKFYTGDSYIILFTKEKNGVFSWDVHFWLGKETTQDESGAAAILTVQLDDQLGGGPVQYREVQNHESQLFLSHFKNGVRYAAGGVASGFTTVDRDAFETRLFHVKGKKNVRVKQVEPSIASMNQGDCFILDVGKTIYVFVGTDSKRIERLKAISAANDVRDQDHSGRGKVLIIDDTATEDEVEAFFQALGGGSADDIPDESVAGSDDEFESDEERTVTLYKVSDSTGSIQITPISSKPLKQAYLDTNDCFILETGGANIYVWVGKRCTNNEKSQSMTKAEQFIDTKNYPAWTRVQRVVEGAEPASFKQYFQTWKGPNEQYTRLIRSAGEERELTRLEQKSAGEAPEFMPDDGSGDVEIYRVEDFELVPVPTENYGKFFGGDSYVIKYSYGNKYIIYMWQGNDSSLDEKAASAMHAVRLDNELSGAATQVRVVQGHEPKHFLHIFKGQLIIFLGGRASGFKNMKDHDTYVQDEVRMFKVRGTSDVDVRAVQLVANSGNLESDDVFIVENGTIAWIWQGRDSNDDEKSFASGILDNIDPDAQKEVIEEGEEPEEFWNALGGQAAYKTSFEDDLIPLATTLYHARLNRSNKLLVDEIENFTQQDLVQDDIMILDATNSVFLWVGKDSSEKEKEMSYNLVQRFLKKKNRLSTVVFTIKQGEEPEAFTSLFSSWDDGYWNDVESYESVKSRFQNMG